MGVPMGGMVTPFECVETIRSDVCLVDVDRKRFSNVAARCPKEVSSAGIGSIFWGSLSFKLALMDSLSPSFAELRLRIDGAGERKRFRKAGKALLSADGGGCVRVLIDPVVGSREGAAPT